MSIDFTGVEVLGYRLTELVGEGGMASVWKAHHEALHKTAAVKILDPALAREPSLVERFRGEAAIQHRLRHPNIVAVENFGLEPLAIVMEFVEGRSLAEVIERETGPIPGARGWRIIAQMMDAVQAAHQAGVIHRDLKPSNVVLGPGDFVKVMDFGIAKVMGDARMTRTGVAMGTAAYMSPEQIRGEPDIDVRTDIYALGVTMYEMWCGRLPFQSDERLESDFAVRMAQVNEAPPDPRAFYPAIPAAVVSVILRALEKERSARFGSVAEMKQALAAALGVAVETALPGSAAVGASKPSSAPTVIEQAVVSPPQVGSRSRLPMYLIVGVAALVVVAVVIVAVSGKEEASERKQDEKKVEMVAPAPLVQQRPESVPVARPPEAPAAVSVPVARPSVVETGASAPRLVYRARLSRSDHHNSKGVRLQSAAGIVRQDRANYHRYSVRDSEDEWDSAFGDKDRRAWLGRVLDRSMSSATARRILRGYPLVEVQVWDDRASVTVLSD